MTKSATSAPSEPNDHTLGNARVGARLRQLRQAAGLSQRELAELASPYLKGAEHPRQGFLSREALNRIETARRAFKYGEAVALANALGVDMSAFSSEAAAEGAASVLARRVA